MILAPDRLITAERLDRTAAGDVLRDPLTGQLRVVVRVTSGAAIRSSDDMRGSHADRCAMYGGKRHGR